MSLYFQAGKIIPKNSSVINIENCSWELQEDYFSSPGQGPIPMPDSTSGALGPVLTSDGDSGLTKDFLDPEKESTTTNVKTNRESFGELDSPESISQIDLEDCFSWEDDTLSLAIDTDKSEHFLDDSAGLASSFKEISVLDKLLVTEVVDANKGITADKYEAVPAASDVMGSNTSSPGKCTCLSMNVPSQVFQL